MSDRDLAGLSDEELGRLVRNTGTFRVAVACSRFADEARELREHESDVYGRLVTRTHEEQTTNVRSRSTTAAIIGEFLDVVEAHAALAEEPDDAAEQATDELVAEGGDA